MSNFPIFSVVGIEIEYMLVDKNTLDVQPKSDLILSGLAGQLVNEIQLGDIAISNELVMHVLELKNNGPKPIDAPIFEQFQHVIINLQPLLAEHDLVLMPSGAHPWMNPLEETRRWPYENMAIYNQYDSIFDCQGHGWANLQSMHVNLPYATQDEFDQLHNLIRIILPLIPALAASTPILDGAYTGMLDSRLYYYESNQKKISTISGHIIPEFIRTETEYHEKILTPMYQEISPYDPEKILQYPWLNSRAAIPKFDQKAIEIRIIDSQECIYADIAIAKVIFALLKHWHSTSEYYLENPCETHRLKRIYDQAIKTGFSTLIEDKELLNQWQLPRRVMNIREIWTLLIEQVSHQLEPQLQTTLEHILKYGNLSERLLCAIGKNVNKQALKKVYSQLTHCLVANELLMP